MKTKVFKTVISTSMKLHFSRESPKRKYYRKFSKCDADYFSLEAVVQMCSVEKVFLKILQNSQENTCARVSFSIKLQALGMQLY